MKTLLSETRAFLIKTCKEHQDDIRENHKLDYEAIIMHTFRVYSLVQQILANEGSALSAENVENIKVATLLHDIGKCIAKSNLTKASKELVSPFLHERLSEPRAFVILNIMEAHSQKEKRDNDLLVNILNDANTLDETGAMSVLYWTRQLDGNSPYYAHELKMKLQHEELAYCEASLHKLKTDTAIALLQERRQFIKHYITQLEKELSFSEEIINM
ncbi:MAG: HD domain-containing protein [Erysipelotrichaceae bacterium]